VEQLRCAPLVLWPSQGLRTPSLWPAHYASLARRLTALVLPLLRAGTLAEERHGVVMVMHVRVVVGGSSRLKTAVLASEE
jgi:hypothetical protein